MKYRIEHKIKTLAQLWEPFEYAEFRFSQWEFSLSAGSKGEAWVAEKTVEATDASAAINHFRRDLIPIIDRIAFVSQCFTSVELESFMIVREDPTDGTFFFRHSVEVTPVPLQFGKEELFSLRALEAFQEKGDTFRFLREAGSASTFYSRFAMLLSALESIAGTKTTGNRIETDKNFIAAEILRDQGLYKELFEYGVGARNKLFHGDKVVLKGGRQYIDEIYWAIVKFFNERCGTKINQTVVNPMRHVAGEYEVLNIFLQAIDGHVPSLRQLCMEAEQGRHHGWPSATKYRAMGDITGAY